MTVAPESAGFGSSLQRGVLMWEDFIGVTMVPGIHITIHVPPPGTCPVPYNRHQEHNDDQARGKDWSFMGPMDPLLEGTSRGGRQRGKKMDLGVEKSAVPQLSLDLQ